MQNEFTFEVELHRAPDTPLGLDLILAKTELDGSLLVVEKVKKGGLIETWNCHAAGPYRVQPGDIFASANGVHDDANAISNLLRTAKDTLRITVLRKQVLDSQWLPQAQAERPGPAMLESAVGPMARVSPAGMGMGASGPLSRGGPRQPSSPPMPEGSSKLPEGVSFEVTLQKPRGAYLGIDMLPAPEVSCLMVKQVLQGGVVFAWNLQNSQYSIQPGDYIVRVNNTYSDIKAVMEEMRAKSELRITLMRRRAASEVPGSGRKFGGKLFQSGADGSLVPRRASFQAPDPPGGRINPYDPYGAQPNDLDNLATGNSMWPESQNMNQTTPFTFQVDIEKPLGHKLGVDVMLVTGYGACGLLVGQVAPGSYVDQWNMRNQWPLQIQKGDLIVAANGINACNSLPRMAQEFDVDVQRVCFTVQRSGPAMQGSAPARQGQMSTQMGMGGQMGQMGASGTHPMASPSPSMGTSMGASAGASNRLAIQSHAQPDVPMENSFWHGASGMAPGNWVKPLGTSPVPQDRPAGKPPGIQPVQLNMPGRSGFYPQALPDMPDDFPMSASSATRMGHPVSLLMDGGHEAPFTSNKMPVKIPDMALAEARAAAEASDAVAVDAAEATATAIAAAVVEDLGLDSTRREGTAKSKLPPAKLLLCTLQLSDEDLTHVLQEALARRPWLTVPVKQAMMEHSASRSAGLWNSE